MFAIEGLVIYYSVFLFLCPLFGIETPLKDGVETLVVIGGAVAAYSEYKRVSASGQTLESKKTQFLYCVKRDLSAAVLYFALAIVVSKYMSFFFGAALFAFVFFLWRRRICKNRGW